MYKAFDSTLKRDVAIDVILKIILGIGDALSPAYSRKFLASDIKPSNIILTKDDQPFIYPMSWCAKLSGKQFLQILILWYQR